MVCALASAVCFGTASVLQAAAVRAAEPGSGSGVDPVLLLRALRQWRYAAGLALDGFGFLLQIVALRSIPLYAVGASLAASLAVTAIAAVRFLGVRLTLAEWSAVATVCAGLAMIAVASGPEGNLAGPPALRWSLLVAAAAVLLLGALAGRLPQGPRALVLGLGAGVGFAVVEVAVRLIDSLAIPRVLGNPALYALALGGLSGFLLLTSAFQRGSVTVATAGMVLAESTIPALVGIAWLGDRPREGLHWLAGVGFVAAVAAALALTRFGEAPAKPPADAAAPASAPAVGPRRTSRSVTCPPVTASVVGARGKCSPRVPSRPTLPRGGRLGPACRRGAVRTWAYVRSAPGTYVWLAALLVTTVIMRRMSPGSENEFLRQRSTNIHELSTHPVRVLISSAFWIDGGGWLSYAALYTVFHAQAERWLGTLRWLLVVAAAHVLATLISEGALLWAVRHDLAPQSAVNTLDVGVSYALAGAVAVLTYRIAAPWRYGYLVAVLAVYGAPLVAGRTFTDLGHFTSVLIGLACYPLTRNRGPAWNPKSMFSRASDSRHDRRPEH